MTTRIGTHNGIFHADDVLAVAVIATVCKGDVQIVRTRDPKVLETCDVVVDVGGVYDKDKQRYDHHQTGRAGERPNGVLYSSAGLVWWSGWGADAAGGSAEVLRLVDEALIQGVDAQDNGQEMHLDGKAAFQGLRMPISQASFSSIISGMNPGWNEEKDFDNNFQAAVGMAKIILKRTLAWASGLQEAKGLAKAALERREDPRLVVLESFHPWQGEVVEDKDVLFCVYPSETGTWMIQCVPDALGSFGKRKPLPAAWAGLRDADLAALTGVGDAVFAHPGLFIGGAKSREGALALVKLALAE